MLPVQASTLGPPRSATSRTLVIGLGDFGLQALSLLLPRLELYYRLVVPGGDEPPLTSCGLLLRQNGTPFYYSLDRSSSAFANVNTIQRAVLQPTATAPLREQLLRVLQPHNSAATATDEWVQTLAAAVLRDARDYTPSLAFTQVVIVASAIDDPSDDLAAVVRAVDGLSRALHVNLLLHLGRGAQGVGPTEHSAFLDQVERVAQGSSVQRIYVLDNLKQNLTTVQTLGELALSVCNFLELNIFSRFGDESSAMLLPDEDVHRRHAPYSTFGTTKLYVPLAEISGELIDQAVAELLQQAMQQPPRRSAGAALSAPIRDALDLRGLCYEGLAGVPVAVQARSGQLGASLQELAWRLRRVADHPQNVQRRLLRQVPRLGITPAATRRVRRSRSQLVLWRQELGSFERQLLHHDLDGWADGVAQRLGIAPSDEGLVYQLQQAAQSKAAPLAFAAHTPLAERAAGLAAWVAQTSPQRAVDSAALQQQSQQTLFDDRRLSAHQMVATASSWLGHWLDGRPAQTSGKLVELLDRLRLASAAAVAEQPALLGELRDGIRAGEDSAEQLQLQLDAWAAANSSAPSPAARAAQLKRAQERLLDCARAKPFPVAVIARFLLLWLVPLMVLVTGIATGASWPAQWPVTPSQVVLGYTLLLIGCYSLFLGWATLRIRLAQRQIEALVIAQLEGYLEQRLYSYEPHALPPPLIASGQSPQPAPQAAAPTLGVVPAYLQAFTRRILAPSPPDEQLTSSLQATIAGAATLLESGRVPTQGPPLQTPVVAYRPIGQQAAISFLRSRLAIRVDEAQPLLRLKPATLVGAMESVAALRSVIGEQLREAITREYVMIVREGAELQIGDLLTETAPQGTNVDEIIDDLLLRAGKLLWLTHGTPSEAQRRTTHTYLAYRYDAADHVLRRQALRRQRLTYCATTDPYGITVVALVHGLDRPALALSPKQLGSLP